MEGGETGQVTSTPNRQVGRQVGKREKTNVVKYEHVDEFYDDFPMSLYSK